MFAGAAHGGEEAVGFVGIVVGREEEVGVTEDGGERGADFMGDVGEESGLGDVGGVSGEASAVEFNFGEAAVLEVADDHEGEGEDEDDGEACADGDGDEGLPSGGACFEIAGNEQLAFLLVDVTEDIPSRPKRAEAP